MTKARDIADETHLKETNNELVTELVRQNIKIDSNTKIKANLNGDASQRFKVADAVELNEAVNKKQFSGIITGKISDPNYIDINAVGANPVAVLYEDGTIVGSTDNGGYIKRPYGQLICFCNEMVMPYENFGYVWSFPYHFVGKRIAIPTAASSVSDVRNTVCATRAFDDNDSMVDRARFSFWTRNQDYATDIDGTSYTASAIAFGRWK